MNVTSHSFPDGARIPSEYAAGVPGPGGPVPGPDKSPQLKWSGFPEATRSFAVLCHDPDVPSRADDVNRTDRTVPYDLPRVDFYHWVLVDVPVERCELPEGIDGEGLQPGGRPAGATGHGVRGLNDYTGWFADDEAMRGDYGGYDGPWPPFNDERLHHYFFTVYALDVPTLDLPAGFTGADALAALKKHVLDQGHWMGTYALNPDARR